MESSRFAVLFPGALGDFICCLPSLQVLARRAPVEVFARSEFAAIASANIMVRSLERSEISRLFTISGAADETVRRFFAPYAGVYSWTGSAQRVFVASLQSVARGRARIFPFRTDDGIRHQAEYYFRCVHDATPDVPLPTISITAEADAWRERFWQRHSLRHRRVLVIAPGSGDRAKNWPERYFFAVAGWWRDQMKGVVIVLVGPVEEERGGFTELSAYGPTVGNLELAQVAALLGASYLYLGNDSGMTHLAAASGTQTFALFGPSDPKQWRPRGPKVTVLSRHEKCLTCDKMISHRSVHHRCLAGLQPAAVMNAIARYMNR